MTSLPLADPGPFLAMAAPPGSGASPLVQFIPFVLVLAIFYFASSGASAAYLTVSEIFPMESRALSIAFFYAVGTGLGGIVGPLLFGELINTGNLEKVALGFLLGAVVMAIGGIAEIFFGVDAEGKTLESIAEPLTAATGASSSPAAAT